MKFFSYILWCIIGLCLSYCIYADGGEIASLSILVSFITGYIAHVILNWRNKK